MTAMSTWYVTSSAVRCWTACGFVIAAALRTYNVGGVNAGVLQFCVF